MSLIIWKCKIKVITDSCKMPILMPALLTEYGYYLPLINYFINYLYSKSLSWKIKTTYAVQLFLEYASANPNKINENNIFQSFVCRLYTGTINRETGDDLSKLWWKKSRSPQVVRTIIANLNDFFDWLAVTNNLHRAAKFNPRFASSYDKIIDEAAYQWKREKAWLGHTWENALPKGREGRLVRPVRSVSYLPEEPPEFPEDRFIDLITKGFIQRNGQVDLRGILITLLLHCAGFRVSEPFHLFWTDVTANPSCYKKAEVCIRHPRQGKSPGDWLDTFKKPINCNRADYLSGKYSLLPRNEMLGSQHAGWKGGLHQRSQDGDYYKLAFWFWACEDSQSGKIIEASELFMSYWVQYILSIQKKGIIIKNINHPFAFINISSPPLGGMYCIKQYLSAHSRACARIGLKVGKALGTTAHGHRHACARRLKMSGLSREVVRTVMHHSSLESQNIYTEPRRDEIQDALSKALNRLGAISNSSNVADFSLL